MVEAGKVALRGVVRFYYSVKAPLLRPKPLSMTNELKVDCKWYLSSHRPSPSTRKKSSYPLHVKTTGQICKLFLSLSHPAHALQRSRERPSTFENMPFLHVEDAFLGARRAYS